MLVTKAQFMNAFLPYFASDRRFILMACDMGYSVIDQYIEHHKGRVILMGISEQATVGIASGLFMEGFIPVIYSQVPFITMRCFEQLRYDVNEHCLGIKIVGVGACNYFERLGRSHCVDEDDVKIMSVLKRFLILAPTQESLQRDVLTFASHQGPIYVRTI